MNQTTRKYPVGIQTFSEIIQGGYVYVDKTDLMWQLQQHSKYAFLSRPRRFGKSLLSSTMDAFFSGQRELFTGLRIMEMEQDWTKYPVIHLDLSVAKGKNTAEELQRALMLHLSNVNQFGTNPQERTPGEMLEGMIRRAWKQCKEKVVIIVDEYDAPLLEMMDDDHALSAFRLVMKEFYQPLKSCDNMIHFCFITGITKFSQLSIFSTINNINNVSLLPQFATICGITEEEITNTLSEDIKLLSDARGETADMTHQKLKREYDGYHFAENSPEVYNPFSLMKCFLNKKISSYWFESGTPTFLIQQLQHFQTDITTIEHLEVGSAAFDQPTDNLDDALPLLYQSGYLTIKAYDQESDTYTLSFPNNEVRTGYARGLIPAYLGLKVKDTQGFAIKFWRTLKTGDLEQSLLVLKSYLASLPYVEGFKKKLASVATAEGFYEYTFYLIFTSLNDLTRTQVKCSGGRTDIVLFMPETIYVMELKVNGTAQSALDQINKNGYSEPYATDGRKIVKVGIHFDIEKRTMDEWVYES